MANQQTLEELYAIIKGRKETPKEGSYTNYLFDKGLDKIFKNEDPQELVYETADVLYHLLVLLVEKGVPYEAILEELASREGVISKTQERKAITDL